VDQRSIQTTPVDNSITIVTKGVAAASGSSWMANTGWTSEPG